MNERFDQDTGEIVHSLYRRSASLGELFGALAKAQAKIEGAGKDGKNPHFQSRYATLSAVIEASREPLSENGLAVVQMPGNIDGNVAVTTLLGHASGEWIESTVYVAPAKFDAQGLGSVITYLRRYARMAIVGIAPEDDDGEAAITRPSAVSTPVRQIAKSAKTRGLSADDQDPARAAYRRLQYAIDEAGKMSPGALRLVYDGALQEWGDPFKDDAKLVRSASASGLDTLVERAAYWLQKKVPA